VLPRSPLVRLTVLHNRGNSPCREADRLFESFRIAFQRRGQDAKRLGSVTPCSLFVGSAGTYSSWGSTYWAICPGAPPTCSFVYFVICCLCPLTTGRRLPIMKVALNSLLLVGLLGFPSALSAQFCVTDCANVCNSSSDCGSECTLSCDTPSTCGAYGVCNPDPDGDGLTWNDNCPYAYNPDQADCDGDGTGTACDTDNGTWSQISTTNMCVIIGRTHVGYVDVQAHVEAEYQDVSACGSPNKWKGFAIQGATCYGFITVSTCCDNTYGHTACLYYLNQNACHS
jgi:hypothetical protein